MANSYAQAKGRSHAEADEAERHEALAKRIAADNAPLTAEEEARAKANWNYLKKHMPWMAEFVQALAARSDFNGRRALANMQLYPSESGEDASLPPFDQD